MRQVTLMFVALVTTPFVSRILLVWDTGSIWAWQDLRGFLSDLGISLLALPVLLLARKASRWIGVLFILLWVVSHWVNFETVAELGSLGTVHDLEFLTDGTFLSGSATAITRPIVLSVLCLASGFWVWWIGSGWSIRAVVASLAAAGAVFMAQGLWPVSQDLAEWRQRDFLQATLVYLMRPEVEPASPSGDTRAAMLELVPEMVADLEGEPILPLPGAARNVLLVIVEGVSGAFVPSLAADHNLHGLFEMPNLDRIATSALSYSTFVSQNRKTNRGVFALLCGEPPNLVPGSPKMTQVAMVGGRVCLPQVLKDAGYQTAFLQAAPLAFMIKDQFAAKAGYDRIFGRGHFDAERAAAHNKWGIDDRSLFEQSMEVIDELRAGANPWFASILTVGTHHPFVFPEESSDSEAGDTDRRRAAFKYADQAVGWLVEELDRRGVLEDTLVLITSDESRGALSVERERAQISGAIAQRLSQNWGVLVALQPDDTIERIKEPFAQMDLALSVLDYLGLTERAGIFFGRSVFRRYQASRLVPFANTNFLRAGAIDSAGTLYDCRIDTDECGKWWIGDKSFFGSSRMEVDWQAATDGWVLDFARRSQAEAMATRGEYEAELLTDARQQVRDDRLLHGGPYITLMPGQWLEVDIEVEVQGSGGVVSFKHKLTAPREWGFEGGAEDEAIYHEAFDLGDGDRLHLNYTVVPEGGGRMDGVKIESNASAAEGAVFDLFFHSAVMKVHVGEEMPEPGFQLRQQELTRSNL